MPYQSLENTVSPRQLQLPASGNRDERIQFDDVSSVVIIGANGSGKSRLGIWIENHKTNARATHRISAQRALSFKSAVEQKPLASSYSELMAGPESFGRPGEARHYFRWNQHPASHVLNDYDSLLSLLFAYERQRNSAAIASIKDGESVDRGTLPESRLDILQRIWNDVLPHRRLLIKDDAVRSCTETGDEYDAIEMSDGERVAFYLIGQALCAPDSAVLIIDEPEIHLHASLRGRLWDAIESVRTDCTFVYITHNLDFAAERTNAETIWVESYDGSNWRWQEVNDNEDLPAALTLEILGSRKPILFVEGEADSIDPAVYRTLFPDHRVIPRGSCFSVIRSVRAVNEPGVFPNQTAYGLIDRDRRSSQELDALVRDNIFACPVAEVENLLCLPEALEVASASVRAPEKAAEAKAFAIREFRKESEIDRHAVAFAYKSVHFQLGRFAEEKRWSKDDLVDAYETHLSAISVEDCFSEERERLSQIASRGDYVEILQVFNRKGLVNQLAEILGLKPAAYREFVFRTLEDEHQNGTVGGLLDAIRVHLPTIPAE